VPHSPIHDARVRSFRCSPGRSAQPHPAAIAPSPLPSPLPSPPYAASSSSLSAAATCGCGSRWASRRSSRWASSSPRMSSCRCAAAAVCNGRNHCSWVMPPPTQRRLTLPFLSHSPPARSPLSTTPIGLHPRSAANRGTRLRVRAGPLRTTVGHCGGCAGRCRKRAESRGSGCLRRRGCVKENSGMDT
jgi:hypothetical protein